MDLVTETDKAVEDMIREKLSTAFPDFKFMGEESFSGGDNAALSDAPTFIVDPIDGTTNFIHGFPYACTSLGLSIDKEPVVGVIYNPFLDHLYTGVKDKGSYLITNAATDSPIKAALPLKSLPKNLLCSPQSLELSGAPTVWATTLTPSVPPSETYLEAMTVPDSATASDLSVPPP